MITIELPYPPSINHYYSYIHGRPVLSKDARSYRKAVRRLVIAAQVTPMFGPLAVRIEIYPPDKRRRDCDNAQKAILDALQHGGAFLDDSQIVWLLTVKADPVADAVANVTIHNADDVPQTHAISSGGK